MLWQISLGTALILLSVLFSGGFFLALETGLSRFAPWLHREPHGPKLMLVLCLTVLWTMALTTLSVWIWALTFRLLALFPSLEESVYFAMVAFTTLGFGDILLPKEWRLLGGMSAANGLLNFGIMTAMLVEVMRNLRASQHEKRHARRDDD